MRFGILILAWVTPAIIAGMLGWKGISGSAFGDYLIYQLQVECSMSAF